MHVGHEDVRSVELAIKNRVLCKDFGDGDAGSQPDGHVSFCMTRRVFA